MTTSNNVTLMLSPDQHRQQEQKEKEVQVDLSSMFGRIKPKPVCVDETLKQQAMSCEEISKFVFETDTPKDAVIQELSVVSSGSSTASRENGLSDTTSEKSLNTKEAVASTIIAGGSFLHRKTESERINLRVKTQTTSRNGRETQRWYTCPTTKRLYRMTTGCIPVLRDGRILFCSASRKPEWILPKGGWEKDEALEESAIRETYEEAGVFGIIGPCLGEIEFETRKGKKRRIEFEEIQRKAKLIRKASASSAKAAPRTDEAMAPPALKNREVPSCVSEAQSPSSEGGQAAKPAYPSSDGDNISVASETSLSHSYVKLRLSPLYVTEVMETWPEQGRFRKVVDIDEAIKISESRPYFHEALKELKERNLHISPELQTSTSSSATDKDR